MISAPPTATTSAQPRPGTQSDAYRQGYSLGEAVFPVLMTVGAAYGLWYLIRRANRLDSVAGPSAEPGIEPTPTAPTPEPAKPTADASPAAPAPTLSAMRARTFAQTSCAFTLLTIGITGLSSHQTWAYRFAIQIVGTALLLLSIVLALIALIRPARDRTKGVHLPAGVALTINGLAIAFAIWGILDP